MAIDFTQRHYQNEPMATITFDTLKYVERLKAAGVSDAQAKAEAEALQAVLAETLDMHLATKADAVKLDRRMDTLESKMEARFERVDGELKLVKWMLAIIVAAEVMPLLAHLFKP